MNNIIFKTILLKGEAGNNIGTIEKTATSGVVDTYTITLTDGTTTTFQVTNGSNIASIQKTATSGLVDTYTVMLTNGDTSTFEVTNGADGANLNLAPTERENTASQSYAVGEHLVSARDGYYYKVTDAIAVGDTLDNTQGGNIKKTFVADEIEAITDEIETLETDLTANNKKFNFSYDSTNQKYGYTVDGVFYPFRKGAILVGTYSANTTIDVSDYGATSADQFLLVPYTNQGPAKEGYHNGPYYSTGANAYFYAGSLSLSSNNLTITLPKARGAWVINGYSEQGYADITISCKLYYVGDIESLT